MTSPPREWFTVRDLAARLHVSPRHARRLVAPYREHCHLARHGRHPRLVLWLPFAVVLAIERLREGRMQRPA